MMLAAMEGTEDALARAEGRPSPREHQSSAKAGSNHPNAKRSGTAKTLPNRFICNPLCFILAPPIGRRLSTRTYGELAASRFEVTGHTDASGKRAYNQKLSERRARAVVAYLANPLGVKRSHLTATGKGEDALKDPLNAYSSANRRVEIINLTPAKPTAAIRKSSEKKANDILIGKKCDGVATSRQQD